MASIQIDRSSANRRRTSIPKRLWADRWCYIFMLPALVLIVMFSFYPIVASWYYSLLDWSGIGGDRTFIGLDNYREIVKDPFFWDAFRRSFYFMFATVPFEVGFSLIVAVILNDRALRFGAVFRTFFFIPVVTTTAIMSIVMSFVFGAFNGPVNGALIWLNILDRPIDWLGDPDTALWTMALIGVWKWFGQPMIYWLAALQTIPQDLYEAARVDGANSRQLFRGITLQLLVPFLIIIVTLTFLDTLEIFDLMLTMTGGGPFYSTEVIDIFIYRQAFASAVPRLGYASAAAVVFGLATLGLALIQILAVSYARRARRDM